MPIAFLTPDAQRVSEVSHFSINHSSVLSGESSTSLSPRRPIPCSAYLKDGTALHDIHHIILCTGYHCTVPFLPDLHNDSMSSAEAINDPTVLATDGTQYHNLHKDIFYIPDPTLAFVGVPYYTATFTLFEFQAIVVAAVFAGVASLPSQTSMRAEYEDRVARKGSGRGFHSLRDQDMDYVDEILAFVNEEGKKRGRAIVQGHTNDFKKIYEIRRDLTIEAIARKHKHAKAYRNGKIETTDSKAKKA